MDILFADMNNRGRDTRPYLDDIIYGAASEKELIEKRTEVLKLLSDNDLHLNHDKTVLG